MRHPYYESVLLIERLHRYFLEVIKVDLDRQGIQDINNVQALILYNIGDDELTVGELTARGYYLGSNVSYNVKKMVENGYLEQERSPHDKRSVRVQLSAKAKALRDRMSGSFEKHVTHLAQHQLGTEDLTKSNDAMRKLERFWGGLLTHGQW